MGSFGVHRILPVQSAGAYFHYAIRFGDGVWHGTHAEPLLDAPLTPLCLPDYVCPALAERLTAPADLARERLLRSYRPNEWTRWFEAAGVALPMLRGPLFDSSALMVAAAAEGLGVALAPTAMFDREITAERLVQPFPIEIDAGRCWLTRLLSRHEGAAMRSFRNWPLTELAPDQSRQNEGAAWEHCRNSPDVRCLAKSWKGACMTEQDDEREIPKLPFGTWLRTQRDRGDWVDGDANAARADRTFPKDGDPEAVRAHLRKQQADGDAFVAIDDAESDWMAT